jgi:uncharacterized protein (TIGR03435 family)
MRVVSSLVCMALLLSPSFGQEPTFAVASLKPCQQLAGTDANNCITFGPGGLIGGSVTLKRLLVEAYGLRPHQASGPT